MRLFLFPFSPIVIFTRYFSLFSFYDLPYLWPCPSLYFFFRVSSSNVSSTFSFPGFSHFSFSPFYHHFICHIFIYFFRRYFFISFIGFMVLSSLSLPLYG